MTKNFESHGDIVGKNVSLKSGDFSELFKGLQSGLITQTPAAREGMRKALEAENYRKMVKQAEYAVKGLEAYNKNAVDKAAYEATRSMSYAKQADQVNKALADINKDAQFWNAGMKAHVDTLDQEAANKYVNHVADLRASRAMPTADQIASAGQRANELQSGYIDKVLNDSSHQARAKALEEAYANTDQGKIISDAKALADKKIANERFWTKKAQEHAANEQASMTKAVNDYERIKQERLAQDKLDHTLFGRVRKGAGNIKSAAVQGFHGLSGKVQDLTGLSDNAANIATGAGLGLAAAGLIGGGIALHRHLKKKKAARRAGNMSQRDFGAFQRVTDSIAKEGPNSPRSVYEINRAYNRMPKAKNEENDGFARARSRKQFGGAVNEGSRAYAANGHTPFPTEKMREITGNQSWGTKKWVKEGRKTSDLSEHLSYKTDFDAWNPLDDLWSKTKKAAKVAKPYVVPALAFGTLGAAVGNLTASEPLSIGYSFGLPNATRIMNNRMLAGAGIGALSGVALQRLANDNKQTDMSEHSGDFGLGGSLAQRLISTIPLYGTHNQYKKELALARAGVIDSSRAGNRKILRTVGWWMPGLGNMYRQETASATGSSFQDLIDSETQKILMEDPNISAGKARKQVKKALYKGLDPSSILKK